MTQSSQGVSLDNLSTPAPPSFVPPFTIFAPWCFRALLLPDTYQRGKMYALRLLCLLTVRPQVQYRLIPHHVIIRIPTCGVFSTTDI